MKGIVEMIRGMLRACLAALVVGSYDLAHASGPLAQPRVDSFRDPIPSGPVARLGTARFRTGIPFQSVCYLVNDKQVLTGCRDGTVLIWDARSGRRIRQFGKQVHGTTAACVSPSRKLYYNVGDGSPSYIYDIDTGKVRVPIQRAWGLPVERVAGSPDDRRFAAVGLDGGYLYSSTTGKLVCRLGGLAEQVSGVCFTPDGKLLATSDHSSKVSLWDATTGRGRGHILVKGAASIVSLTCSKNGQSLVTVDGNGTVRLVSLSRRLVTVSLDAPHKASGPPELSPDGKFVITISPVHTCDIRVNTAAHLWSTETGKLVGAGPTYTSDVHGLACSPSGGHLASVSLDNVLRVWAIWENRLAPEVDAPSYSATAAAFHPTGGAVVAGYADGKLRRYDTQLMKEAWETLIDLKGISSISFSPDGKMLACGGAGGAVLLLEPETGQHRRELGLVAGPVTALAFSRDSKQLAVGSSRGEIVIFAAGTGRVLSRQKIEGAVIRSVAHVPGGGFVAFGSGMHSVLWKSGGKARIPSLDRVSRKLHRVAIAPDGRALIVSHEIDGCYYVDLSAHSITAPTKVPADENSWVCALAFSPTGRWIALGYSDGHISLLETVTCRAFRVRAGHHGTITQVSFSPCGKYVLTSGADSTVLVWEVANCFLTSGAMSSLSADPAVLWRALSSPDPAVGGAAIVLSARNPAPFLRSAEHQVRSIPPIPSAKLRRWLRDLEEDDFATRVNAEERIERIGPHVASRLRDVIQKSPPLETRFRLQKILSRLACRKPPHYLRDARVIGVLESLDTPAAVRLLRELARGAPEAVLTQVARAALARCKR